MAKKIKKKPLKKEKLLAEQVLKPSDVVDYKSIMIGKLANRRTKQKK